MVLVADRAASSGDRLSGRGAALNALAAAVLLATGLHNLPLAVPGAINIAYGRATGRGLGRVLLAAAVGVYGLLLAGSIAFMASGKTFEEFRGIR